MSASECCPQRHPVPHFRHKTCLGNCQTAASGHIHKRKQPCFAHSLPTHCVSIDLAGRVNCSTHTNVERLSMIDASQAEEADNSDGPSPSTALQMRTSLDKFKFSPSAPSPLRRSARFTAIKQETQEEDRLPSLASSSSTAKTSRKRSASELTDLWTEGTKDSQSNRKKRSIPPTKLKKEYALPEVYAHLDCLTDRLREELDGTQYPQTMVNSCSSPYSRFRGYQVRYHYSKIVKAGILTSDTVRVSNRRRKEHISHIRRTISGGAFTWLVCCIVT